MRIMIQQVGSTGADIIRELQACLTRSFGCSLELADPIFDIDTAFNVSRNQYKASVMLAVLAAEGDPLDRKALGITDVDLYDDGLNYVFGEAERSCGVAIISLARLRQEFYQLPCDKALLLERATKESVHELGHTFGLEHCSDPVCVMYFSQCLADTDWKSAEFCSKCRPKLIV